jgi:hypothetical protein
MLNIHSLYTHPLTQWRFWQGKSGVAGTVSQVDAPVNVDQAHRAFHRAYRCFVQKHPLWIARRFDELLLHSVLPALAANAPLPTAHDLALAWDRQFGVLSPYPLRLQQRAELDTIAGQFLQQLADERCNQSS